MRSPLASAVVALALALAVSGCDSYEPRNQPWPREMELRLADGRTLSPDALKGRPWVINVWRPG